MMETNDQMKDQLKIIIKEVIIEQMKTIKDPTLIPTEVLESLYNFISEEKENSLILEPLFEDNYAVEEWLGSLEIKLEKQNEFINIEENGPSIDDF